MMRHGLGSFLTLVLHVSATTQAGTITTPQIIAQTTAGA